MKVDNFWNEFLRSANLDMETKYIDCYHFDSNEESANHLLNLVLQGKKKATAGAYDSYLADGDELPKIGDYTIITDWDGKPGCVIQVTEVTLLPFNEITFDLCKREGEDDNLESWQRNHEKFFMEDAEELGYEFNENSLIVFTEFEVVYS